MNTMINKMSKIKDFSLEIPLITHHAMLMLAHTPVMKKLQR